MHLARFTEEGLRQQRMALTALLHDRAQAAADRDTFRGGQLDKLTSARSDKAQRLARDEAVHAALLKRKVGWCRYSEDACTTDTSGCHSRPAFGHWGCKLHLAFTTLGVCVQRSIGPRNACPHLASRTTGTISAWYCTHLQEEIEREELRVELALSEKARRKKLEELHHAALDVHGGIDAFEINMKRLVRGDTGEGEEVLAPPAGRTPLEHMELMKSRAAATVKLLEDTAAYMRGVKDARADDIASKREREVGGEATVAACRRAMAAALGAEVVAC